jgi:phosphatidylglycerol---prolipoprotein diacylglyceryl transferase
MYAAALLFSSVVTAGTTGLPYFHIGSWGIIQGFGVIVAAGVLIGASLLRRYAEWHGVDDEHIRGLTGWVTVAGFLGAHIFDVLAYQWDDLVKDPVLLVKIWAGISSYGGFIGGAIGFALYVWWKRQPVRLFADITIVGLLPAFSIGRIGCSVVSDHIGAIADPNNWYSFLAENYPRSEAGENSGIGHLFQIWDKGHPGTQVDSVLAWNLGLIELLYLIPVNLLILWLAFRTTKRLNAGFITVLTGVLYAPVRFFLDYLRPENSDPRYFSLTFAQWSSILAFGAALYAANRIFRTGAVAETVTKTSGEAQAKLKSILKDDGDKAKRDKEEAEAEKARKEKERQRLREEQRKEDEELAKEALAAKADEAKADEPASDDDEEDEEADDEDEKKEAKPAPKPASTPSPPQQQKKQGGGGGGGKKKKKKKR